MRVVNVDEQLKQLAAETEVLNKAASKTQVLFFGGGTREGRSVCPPRGGVGGWMLASS